MSQRCSEPVYRYSIDSTDRVSFVSELWLDFAASNDAPELTRERVIGQPIWQFLQGQRTQDLYRELFEKLRRFEAPLSIPFRCDAPDRYRFMRLEMSPAKRGAIDFTGRLLREQLRVYLPILDPARKRADYGFPLCSLCKRVFAGGSWLELEAAVEKLGTFDSENIPRLEASLCEDCRRLPSIVVAGGSA